MRVGRSVNGNYSQDFIVSTPGLEMAFSYKEGVGLLRPDETEGVESTVGPSADNCTNVPFTVLVSPRCLK